MKKGFTYVEVLVILALISILVTCIKVYVKYKSDHADEVYTQATVITYINAFNLFYKDKKAFPLPSNAAANHVCLTSEPCQFNNQEVKQDGALYSQLRPYIEAEDFKTTHVRKGVQGILYMCQEVVEGKCVKAIITWAEKNTIKKDAATQCLRGVSILSDKDTLVCQYDFR